MFQVKGIAYVKDHKMAGLSGPGRVRISERLDRRSGQKIGYY